MRTLVLTGELVDHLGEDELCVHTDDDGHAIEDLIAAGLRHRDIGGGDAPYGNVRITIEQLEELPDDHGSTTGD